MSELTNRLGQIVRAHRESLGISQETLAARSELDRTYISGLERGLRNPTIETVEKIARELGLAVSQLLAEAEGGH